MAADLIILAEADSGAMVAPVLDASLQRGTPKLVQRVVLELFTERGTLRYRPERGTRFLRDLRLMRFRNETQLLSVFAAARLQLKANLQSDQTDADATDEQLKDVVVSRLTLLPGRLLLTLQVQSQADSVYTFTTRLNLSL